MIPLLVYRVFLVLILLETVCSLIITSVYAGRKKFKTYSFDYLLPPIVLEKPHKLQLSYNGHWTLRKPNFRIKFNMPIKLPLHLNYGDNYEDAGEHDAEAEPEYNSVQDSPSNSDGNNYDGDDQTYDNEYHDAASNHNSESSFKAHGSPQVNGNVNLNPPDSYGHQESGSYGKIQLGEKTPYTGKAQVTSFIDNGHLVNAHRLSSVVVPPNNVKFPSSGGGMVDAAYGDQMDSSYSNPRPISTPQQLAINVPNGNQIQPNRPPQQAQMLSPSSQQASDPSTFLGSDKGSFNREDIRRSKAHAAMKLMALKKMKMVKVPLLAKKLVIADPASKIHTIRLGYKLKPPEVSFITMYENTPDAVPLSLPLSKLSNYYSSLTFTNGMRGIPYDPAGFGPLGTLKWLAKLGKKPKVFFPLKAAKMIKLKG